TAVPSLATGSTQLVVQARATDTGGNSALSAPLLFEIVPDTTAPAIVAIDPPDGAIRNQGFRVVQIDFTEPMDETTLTLANILLVRANEPGSSIAPLDAQIGQNSRSAQFTYARPFPGDYQIILLAPNIADRAGNPLGSVNLTNHLTVQESIARWINPQGGFWDAPTNWSGGVLPGPDDLTIID